MTTVHPDTRTSSQTRSSRRRAPERTGVSHLARPVLAAVVLVQAAGQIIATSREPTAVGSWLFLFQEWPESASQGFEWAGTLLAALGSLAVVIARAPRLRLIGAAMASGWFVALPLAEWRIGGAPFTELALVAQATRIAAPLVLAVWDRQHAAEWLLRPAVALTFAAHGLEAFRLHPAFVDYLLAADRFVFGAGLTQHGAELLLRVIGVHDLALATFVLLGGRRAWVLGWMTCWGLVTAGSRVVQGGDTALYLSLIRVANGGLPLILLLLSGRTSMSRIPIDQSRRLARAALPLLLLLLPLAASAQPLGDGPGQLRVIWGVDPAHRATIAWSTRVAGDSPEVHIDTEPRSGAVDSYARTVAAGANGEYTNGGGFYHHADVTGLLPSTTYYFVVVSDGKVSPEYHFVTAPVDDRPFRLLYGGDSRRPGEADRRTMNELIARMVEEDPGIIAIAHGGDYIQSEDSWEEWDSWMADHELTFTSDGRILPVIPTRGNHEGDGVMFNQVFGFPGGPELDYYATKLGANTLFLTLDTNVSIGGDQTAWLEQQLKDAGDIRWLFTSYHRPAYPAAKEPSGARQFWVPVFEKYSVDVALESDGHVLKRTVPIRDEKEDPTGVVYVGEGGLGVPQREPNMDWYLESPGMATSAHHVQRFSISPTEMVYEAVLMDGKVGDSLKFTPKRAGVAAEPGPAEPGTEPGLPPTPEEPTAPGTPEETGTPTSPGTPEEPATPEEPGFLPVTVDGVTARSPTEVVVTFSTDMTESTTARASAYDLSPTGEVTSVELENPRTALLTTTELLPSADYDLKIDGPTSAEGEKVRPTTVTFSVRDPNIEPGMPSRIEPAAQGGEGGCGTAGGSFASAGLLAVALAAALRRRQARR